MAQRVVTKLIDDLSGSEIPDGEGETVRFSLDGVQYEIDLSTKNAEKLRSALSDYIERARRVGRSRNRRQGSAPRSTGPTPGEIRAWAAQQGYEVSGKGRVPGPIRDAFLAAHPN